jgi:hypothetical protein
MKESTRSLISIGRRSSAPPLCISDVGDQFDTTIGNSGCELAMSSADMAKYRVVEVICDTPSSKVMIVDGGMVLKLRPIRVDVVVIAHHMMLASTVIKVPKVYDFGFSGNCGFILMEHIHPAANLQVMLQNRVAHRHWIMSRVSIEIIVIVRALASVGLSHNDLYPRNILVGRDWEVISVLDWDESGPLESSNEYARRAHQSSNDAIDHLWDHIFLQFSSYSSDRPDNLLDTNMFGMAPLIRSPPGRIIGPLVAAIEIEKHLDIVTACEESFPIERWRLAANVKKRAREDAAMGSCEKKGARDDVALGNCEKKGPKTASSVKFCQA